MEWVDGRVDGWTVGQNTPNNRMEFLLILFQTCFQKIEGPLCCRAGWHKCHPKTFKTIHCLEIPPLWIRILIVLREIVTTFLIYTHDGWWQKIISRFLYFLMFIQFLACRHAGICHSESYFWTRPSFCNSRMKYIVYFLMNLEYMMTEHNLFFQTTCWTVEYFISVFRGFGL